MRSDFVVFYVFRWCLVGRSYQFCARRFDSCCRPGVVRGDNVAGRRWPILARGWVALAGLTHDVFASSRVNGCPSVSKPSIIRSVSDF